MHIETINQIDPGAFRKVLETPAGAAFWCSGLQRYLVQLQRTVHQPGTDTIPSREVWTNHISIVQELIGGPLPGEQLDVFREADAWSCAKFTPITPAP